MRDKSTNILFEKGMQMLKKGNYKDAETTFLKAKEAMKKRK